MKEIKDIDEGTIRRIDWQELLPPVLLFRVFNVSIGVRVLFFAIIGIFLTIAVNLFLYPFNPPPVQRFAEITDKSIGREKGFSMLIDQMNIRNVKSKSKTIRPNIPAEIDRNTRGQNKKVAGDLSSDSKLRDGVVLSSVEFIAVEVRDSVLFVWIFFTRSGGQFFTLDQENWAKRGVGLIGFAATVLVWAFAGGLVCRSVAMRLTCDKTESINELFRFLRKRGLGFLSSVLILTIGILICLFIGMIPAKVAGYLNLTAVNYFVAVIFPFVFLFNFLALLSLVVLWFGFPLLFAAVATDGADGFDAVSRAFSYLFQRPFHYIFYWFLSAVQGFLGYLVVVFFVMGTIMLTEHFAGTTSGLSLFTNTHSSANSRANFSTDSLTVAQNISSTGCVVDLTASQSCESNSSVKTMILSAWFDLLRFLVIAYIFVWFWSSGVAIYLLLRRSVDAAPFTEVYHQEPVKIRTLPKIKIDNPNTTET
ncbi:MAG: hypothetical protein LBL39_05720 [Planctomycetaceae bacterium]|jgi:hypothetical protein|nr:hypothetical protein [Planctomycetaceae bacterium]